MRNFRKPIRNYPGNLSDSSDDDDTDYDAYLQPVFRIDQDDSDGDTANETERFEFNFVFNATDNDNTSTSEEEEEEDNDDIVDEALLDEDEIIEIDTDLDVILGNRVIPQSTQQQPHNEDSESESGPGPYQDGDDDDDDDDIATPPNPPSPGLQESILVNLTNDIGNEEDDSPYFSSSNNSICNSTNNNSENHQTPSSSSSNNNNNVAIFSPTMDSSPSSHVEYVEIETDKVDSNKMDFTIKNASTTGHFDEDDDDDDATNYPEIERLRNSPTPTGDKDNQNSPSSETTTTVTTGATNDHPPPPLLPHSPTSVTSTTTAATKDDNSILDASEADKGNRTPTASSLQCEYSDSSCENTPKKDEAKYEESLNEDVEEEEEMEEQFCNPMVDETSDGDESENALRGDRIGTTTYSERHVLKILMNWMEALPKFQNARNEVEKDTDPPSSVVDEPLPPDMEDAMALLWDMSAETDVMHYLIEKNILGLIVDNLDSLNCPTRLKEIALGILANILSNSSILETFPEMDENLNLVERVVAEGINSTKVQVLTQIFAVLRRVVCYIRNAKPIESWMKFFLDEEFIRAANFLLSSSTNVLLLGDVIMFMFTLMEVLSPPTENDEDEDDNRLEEKSATATMEVKSNDIDAIMTKNFRPITSSDFIPSICEGISELLKKSSNQGPFFLPGENIKEQHPSPAGKIPECATTGNGPDENIHDGDLIIPKGHVQQGILNGLAALCYLHKFKAGRQLLSQHSPALMEILIGITGKFRFITENVDQNETIDYFALAVDLLGFVHNEFNSLQPSALLIPTFTAMFLIDQEEKYKTQHDTLTQQQQQQYPPQILRIRRVDTDSADGSKKASQFSISPFTIILYNYLIILEEKYSSETVKAVMVKDGGEKLLKFYGNVKSIAHKVAVTDNDLEHDLEEGKSTKVS